MPSALMRRQPGPQRPVDEKRSSRNALPRLKPHGEAAVFLELFETHERVFTGFSSTIRSSRVSPASCSTRWAFIVSPCARLPRRAVDCPIEATDGPRSLTSNRCFPGSETSKASLCSEVSVANGPTWFGRNHQPRERGACHREPRANEHDEPEAKNKRLRH